MTLQYLAGFFDGEGSIGINASPRKDKSQKLYCSLRINVANVHPDVINELYLRFGGSIDIVNVGKTNRRQAYRWMIACKKAASFLEAIYPYLVVKREQAKLALIFQKRMIRRNPASVVTEEEMEKRLEIKKKISDWNHKEYLVN